ncbi:MAG: lytic transglycosylase domain-containing protein [Candidatus Baltobacteraceae bacterium]|jgi:type IV secretion system protein VirB1
MIPELALSTYVRTCAPNVSPTTSLAIISVESRGWPWSIRDNTENRAYAMRTRDAATRAATLLVNAGHNVDLGLMQVNSQNLGWLGLRVDQVFDPCTNIAAGGRILTEDYVNAARVYGAGQLALYHAFEAYNSGKMDGAAEYARLVWRAATGL